MTHAVSKEHLALFAACFRTTIQVFFFHGDILNQFHYCGWTDIFQLVYWKKKELHKKRDT